MAQLDAYGNPVQNGQQGQQAPDWYNQMTGAPTRFGPPLRRNRPSGGAPFTLADSIMQRGHMGFGQNIQGAMGQMQGLHMANAATMQQNRDRAAAQQRDFWNARVGMAQAIAPVMAEQFRAQALAQVLGLGGGGGGRRGWARPMSYTSNTGQGIHMGGQQ